MHANACKKDTSIEYDTKIYLLGLKAATFYQNGQKNYVFHPTVVPTNTICSKTNSMDFVVENKVWPIRKKN